MAYDLTTSLDDIVEWADERVVYVEKEGPFQQTAKACWDELHQQEHAKKATKFFAVYKLKPAPIYAACCTTTTADHGRVVPKHKYCRFVLKGEYKHLPEACGKVFEIFGRQKQHVVDEDAWYVEHYASDPKTTPGRDLITEILVPIK